MPSMRASRTRSASACAASDLLAGGQVRLAQLAAPRVLRDERGGSRSATWRAASALAWAAGSAAAARLAASRACSACGAGGPASPGLPPRSRSRSSVEPAARARAAAAVSSSASAWRATARSASSRPTWACCSWPGGAQRRRARAARQPLRARAWRPAQLLLPAQRVAGGGAAGRRAARPGAARPARRPGPPSWPSTSAAAASRSAAAAAARPGRPGRRQARGVPAVGGPGTPSGTRQSPGPRRRRPGRSGPPGGLTSSSAAATSLSVARRRSASQSSTWRKRSVPNSFCSRASLSCASACRNWANWPCGQQDDLEELLGGHAHQVRDLAVGLADPGGLDRPVAVAVPLRQADRGLAPWWCRRARLLRAVLLRPAGDAQAAAADRRLELHLGRGARRRAWSERSRLARAALPGHPAVEGERDRVEQRGLARAGLAVQQEQARRGRRRRPAPSPANAPKAVTRRRCGRISARRRCLRHAGPR